MPRCLLLNQSGHGTSSIAALAVTLHRVTQRDHQRSQERPREIRVALPSTKFENAKSNGLATVAAGANCFARVSGKLAYALFGPSRILVLGPDSALVAIILGVVFPLSQGNALRAVALAGVMAIVSGVVLILAGVTRLGFVTELLSKPIRYGYMNGIALAVVISQLPKVFGFSIDGDG